MADVALNAVVKKNNLSVWLGYGRKGVVVSFGVGKMNMCTVYESGC